MGLEIAKIQFGFIPTNSTEKIKFIDKSPIPSPVKLTIFAIQEFLTDPENRDFD
jgi:hypothetical protein